MCLNTQLEQYQQILDNAQIGWWKADFAGKYYICSDYLIRLFGRTDEKLTFYEFRDMIREDYRPRISLEFLSLLLVDVYEQIFPIHTCFGIKWVRSKLYRREIDENHQVTAYGLLQVLSDWEIEKETRLGKIWANSLLNHLGSLSRSLFSFIQTNDLDDSIQKVLAETLNSLLPMKGRAYIMKLDYEKMTLNCTYEACSEGIASLKKKITCLPLSSVPWLFEKIKTHHSIVINTLDELPREASFEKNLLQQEGVCSFLVIPMLLKDTVLGYMGIDIVDTPRLWENEDCQWFFSITNVITLITEMAKAHEALDRNEKILRNIYTNIPVGIELYDQNGDLQDLNNKDMEIFGIHSKDDIHDMNIFRHPLIPADIVKKMRNREPVSFRLNYVFDKVAGSYISSKEGGLDIITKASMLYDNKGELLNYILINLDNTEKLIARTRIEEFENIFSLVGDYAKVGYAKFDLISCEGTATNQWYENLGEKEGTPLTEIIGIYAHVHKQDRQAMLRFFDKVKQGKAHHIRKELRILTETGTQWVRVNVIRNRQHNDPEKIEMFCINYDITELKENQQQRKKAEELDRLKSAFLANMSHEIRTPLNAIVGFSTLLAETDNPEEKQQFIDIIEKNNDLLLQLISDILDLAKIESNTIEFKFTDVDVKEVLEELTASFRIKMPAEVILKCAPDLSSYVVYSDRNRLIQVLSNFINNAIKYTTQGSITLDYEWLPERIKFSVTDSGEGIPEEIRQRIFERFYKGNTFKQGTGLGLSICETIVHKLGGEIGVESEVGKGSMFWFTIPHAK